MDKVYIIYQILNKINNKVYRGVYTGKDIKINYILPRNKNIKEDIKKLGKENFEKSILYKSNNKNDFIINKKKLISTKWKKSGNTYNDALIGFIQVIDKDGKHYKVKNDDPRYLNGKLIFFSKGKCAARDKDRNSLFADKNDPRFLTGEIVSTSCRVFTAKDKEGNIFKANINDLRYINGEICSVNKGKKFNEKSLLNSKEKQNKRRINERKIKYSNFKFDIEKSLDDKYFLIKNFCKHKDLKIEYRLFDKLYELENNNETIFYCEKCVEEFIENYIPSELDIIKYREICNELHHKQVRYLFKEYYLKYYNPKLYKCIFYFTQKFKDISLIERIYLFRNNIKNPKCIVNNCYNKPKFRTGSFGYNLYCDEHILELPGHFSIEQDNMRKYIQNLFPNLEIKYNDRHLKKELDIWIPSLNIAFEYNGIYYHDEKHYPDKLYHYKKWLLAKNKNIKLIFIWEDNWNNKKDINLSLIKNQFNLYDKNINTKDCVIKEVNFKDSLKFLKENYIEGAIVSKIRLGLFYKDELISLMVFGIPKLDGDKNIYDIELLRFCNKINIKINNSFEILFKYFINDYSYNKIVGYPNLDIREDLIYEKINFNNKNRIKLNYWWVKGKRYNKKYFKNKKDKIMYKLGYNKIWGIGNLKYEYIK